MPTSHWLERSSTLAKLPVLRRLLSWFDSLSKRERNIALVTCYFVSLILVYVLVVDPLWTYRNQQVNRHTTELAGLEWMRLNTQEAQVRNANSMDTSGDTKLSVVANSAKMFNLPLQRIQPNDTGIYIEIRNQKFDKTMRWLSSLVHEHGIQLVNVRLDNRERGLVECRLTVR